MILLALCALAGVQDPPIRVPEGFTVERVAGPPLVDRPIMACFDERGRLYVADSSGVNLKADELLKSPPHRIVMLEDTDGDGRFDKSFVFADKMTFPQGALWHAGALYVASPPHIWKLTDTNGDGTADKREELVGKFGFTGNAADIHGPVLGPDGRLYWCDGRHGHEIKRPDGSVMQGKAARIFRCKTDGSDVEVVCGGGMDNPVEVAFTEEGEALVTVALFESKPRRVDAIIHAVEGGAFPWHEVSREFKRTGDLLPPVTALDPVAPAGFMRYRSGAFGAAWRDNFFSAQFNPHKVQRHVIERDGATFKSRNEDFLVSSSTDFHPTDVLEDADGSLLVVDTGGWFRAGCPTSQIAKPDIKGAIYRVRKKGMPVVDDPRGIKLDWTHPDVLLRDARFAVRDRALSEFRTRPTSLRHFENAHDRRMTAWAYTRVTQLEEAVEVRWRVRDLLDDPDASVRQVAVYSAGLHRDADALRKLMALAKGDAPSIRREAATALGRIGKPEAIPALLESMRVGGDRFLEHAVIYALIRIADRDAMVKALADPHPSVRRAALIALDQMVGGNLTADLVTPQLDPSDGPLREAALSIVTSRSGWSAAVLDVLRQGLADETRLDEMRRIAFAFSTDLAVQEMMARALRAGKTPAETRLALLETMARAPVDRLPAIWVGEVRWALDHADERVVRQAVATARAAQVTELDEPLLALARDAARSIDLRVEALSAAAPRLSRLEPPLFEFLTACLNPEKPPLLRLAAAGALGTAPLSDGQLSALSARAIEQTGALETPRLIPAYERSKNPDVGKRFVAALGKSPGLASLSPEALRRALRGYPEEVRKLAEPLLKRIDGDMEKQKVRMAELEPALAGGDAARGREVFIGRKAACVACHAIAGQGGRVGPDLSKIGALRSGRDLLEAVVFPSASFARGFESYAIRTRDGAVYDGLMSRETADAIYLFPADRVEKRIARASVDAILQSRISIMPQGLDAQLTREELADLVAFLRSLR